jgi:uncharacterized protein YbjT (DUF2867 family)
MVGGEALKLALEHPEVAEVTVIGRKSTGVEHTKLTEVIHEDFGNCAALADVLAKQDVVLFCIGVYTGAVANDVFRTITVDYTVEFAKVLHAASPDSVLCFLSGAGADSGEKSRIAFARFKGMAENALLEMGFARLHLFRPAYVYPVDVRVEPNLSYRLMRWAYPAFSRLMPNGVIRSDDLAWAMLEAGLHGTGSHSECVLENSEIRGMVNARPEAAT